MEDNFEKFSSFTGGKKKEKEIRFNNHRSFAFSEYIFLLFVRMFKNVLNSLFPSMKRRLNEILLIAHVNYVFSKSISKFLSMYIDMYVRDFVVEIFGSIYVKGFVCTGKP